MVKPADTKSTSEISRSHHIQISESGLVTIAGGKWTTYRKMAEDTIDRAAMVAGAEFKKAKTKNQRIHGWLKNVDKNDPLSVYGSDRVALEKLIEEDESLKDRLHPKLPYIKAEIIWAIRNEWAQTIEDLLSRRTRALLLDAEATIEVAPLVAKLLAQELNEDEEWQKQEVKEFLELAKNYVIN